MTRAGWYIARMTMRTWTLCFALLGAATVSACSDSPRPDEAFSGPALREETRDRELRVETVVEGSGQEAKEGDYVSLYYRVFLESGTEVGHNHDRKPEGLLLLKDDEMIEGLQLGLVGARAGELRRVHVPYALGYRDRSINDGQIPPNSNLTFHVEMVAVRPR